MKWWSRRDLFLVVFLFFVIIVEVVSLLFGGKFWLLLEASGVNQGFFSAWMFCLVLVLLGCFGFVFWFIRGKRDNLVVPVVPKKEEVVKVVARDEERRITILDEVEKSKKDLEEQLKRERLQELVELEAERKRIEAQRSRSGFVYYDNGYYDSEGVFHLYKEEENNVNGGD
jgi:hypothetical protein